MLNRRILLLLAMFVCCQNADAATFTVNKTSDSADGSCDADCAMREAILAANANPGPDVIAFALSGTGPFVIGPVGLLPPVDEAVLIDGFSQAGSAPNTLSDANNAVIQIELRNVSGVSIGLALCAPNITVRGLAITGFGFAALHTASNGPLSCTAQGNNLRIEGNFIGLQADGIVARGNARGIVVNGATTQIGGVLPAQRNVISGNSNVGILFEGANLAGSAALGNLIGTDRSGTLDRGNGDFGIRVNASDGVVLGNVSAPNRFAFNRGGIHIGTFSRQIDLALNDFGENDGIGIDLSNTGQPNGVTPNDLDDADSGSNNLQNFPLIYRAERRNDGIHLEGALDVPIDTTAVAYRISVYASGNCDSTGFGEGERLLGSAVINFTQATAERFDFDLPQLNLPSGSAITTVATGPSGSSEFSRCVLLDDQLFSNGFE
jgi:trimeric autotransporter adhesin